MINGAIVDCRTINDELYGNITYYSENAKYQSVFGLAVLPNYQHKGIASKLMEFFIDNARKFKRNGLILTCRKKLIENDNYTVLVDIGTDEPFKDRSCCFLYASGNEVKNNPKRVKAIATAYKKACDWIREHPEETAKIDIDKGYVSGVDEKLLTELIKSYDFNYRTSEAKSDLKYFAKNLSKTGFIKKNTDADKFVKDVYYDVFNEQS